MSLRIKNEATCGLIRRLAKLTGENMTLAVTIALHERIDRVEGKRHPARARSDGQSHGKSRYAGKPQPPLSF